LPDTTRYMSIVQAPYDAPVYSWLVRIPPLMGIDLAAGARGLAMFFVAANTFLVWHLLIRATDRHSVALIGTLLVVIAPQFVSLHSIAMSEAPFLFFLLVTLLAILRYLETE